MDGGWKKSNELDCGRWREVWFKSKYREKERKWEEVEIYRMGEGKRRGNNVKKRKGKGGKRRRLNSER